MRPNKGGNINVSLATKSLLFRFCSPWIRALIKVSQSAKNIKNKDMLYINFTLQRGSLWFLEQHKLVFSVLAIFLGSTDIDPYFLPLFKKIHFNLLFELSMNRNQSSCALINRSSQSFYIVTELKIWFGYHLMVLVYSTTILWIIKYLFFKHLTSLMKSK